MLSLACLPRSPTDGIASPPQSPRWASSPRTAPCSSSTSFLLPHFFSSNRANVSPQLRQHLVGRAPQGSSQGGHGRCSSVGVPGCPQCRRSRSRQGRSRAHQGPGKVLQEVNNPLPPPCRTKISCGGALPVPLPPLSSLLAATSPPQRRPSRPVTRLPRILQFSSVPSSSFFFVCIAKMFPVLSVSGRLEDRTKCGDVGVARRRELALPPLLPHTACEPVSCPFGSLQGIKKHLGKRNPPCPV